MILRSLISGSATVIGPEATLGDAAEALGEYDLGGLAVVSDRNLVGIIAWLLEVGYRHMPVMEDGELLGIVNIRDILRAVIDSPASD